AAAYWIARSSRAMTIRNKKAGVAAGFSSCFNPPELVCGFQRGSFLPRDGAFHRGLHLLEGANLDLPHAFARHAEFGGEVFQGHRLVRQAPRFENAAFARVEHADGAVQRLAAMIEL